MSGPDADGRGETVVLKLGGSVITEKDRPETLDGASLATAADAIADVRGSGAADRLVVVHGGGSFGHHHASEHGVSTTDGTRDAVAVMAVHGAMTTLNRFVLSRLHERDVPAVPVHPLSLSARPDGADGRLDVPIGSTTTLDKEKRNDNDRNEHANRPKSTVLRQAAETALETEAKTKADREDGRLLEAETGPHRRKLLEAETGRNAQKLVEAKPEPCLKERS